MTDIQDHLTRDYHNTNRETGAVLRESRSTARAQQEVILEFFRSHPGRHYSPDQIHQAVLPAAPITSVRRAITNFTDDGFLEKTAHMITGSWGKQVHTWRLVVREMKQGDLF